MRVRLRLRHRLRLDRWSRKPAEKFASINFQVTGLEICRSHNVLMIRCFECFVDTLAKGCACRPPIPFCRLGDNVEWVVSLSYLRLSLNVLELQKISFEREGQLVRGSNWLTRENRALTPLRCNASPLKAG